MSNPDTTSFRASWRSKATEASRGISPPSFTILCNDARTIFTIPNASVHAIVTSVPYWGLRRYVDSDREIGREETLQSWLGNLVDCAREWRRILRDDGTLWINCGDAYANNTKWGGKSGNKNRNSDRGGYEGQRIKQDSDFNPKNLMNLPHHLSSALQDDGWYLRSAIVWVKGIDWTDAEREAQEHIRAALDAVRAHARGSLWGLSKDLDRALRKAEKAVDRLVMSGAAMPESVTDRPTSAYEMLFLFSKSERYFYDREAIRVPRSGNTHSRGEGITPKGKAADHTNIRANSSFHAATSDHLVASRNARNVWRIATEPSPSGGYALPDSRIINHFASYPRALAARVILAATSEAGCCAKCGAPFERVTRPTPQYAQFLGNDWADYEQDAAEGRGHSISPQRPTKRGRAVTAEYITVAHAPTCRCYGEPIEANVPCPACNGTGIKHAYPRGNEPYKAHVLPCRHPRSINTDHDGPDFANPQPVGGPCPACLCPDCGGSGREHKTHVGQTESSYNEGMTANRLALLRQAAREAGSEYNGSFCGLETGEPCSTCNGLGATGHANGETWPDDVLENWPRLPCTVLDPMAGTGQTGMAALDLGRSVILNDLSSNYCDLMRARLDAWPGDLRGPAKASSTDDDELPKPLLLMEVKQCQSDDPA